MEQEFTFSGYRLLIDVEKTRAYYAAHPLPWVTCTCAGCRNFVEAAKQLPPAVQAFFAGLGVDPGKPAETSWYSGTKETVNGDAWYHLCGRIVERVEPPAGQCFGEYLQVSEHLEAVFGPDCNLLPEDFPQPCFQMDVFFQLPWLLEEDNPYEEK